MLLKAIAMGILVTKGSMGAEQEDRRGKELNKAVREVEMAREVNQWAYSGVDRDTHIDTASRISELLEGIEGRKEKRRNLLSQPRTFDLSVHGIDPVLWHLNKAREFSEQGSPIKVKALTLLNIADWQLNQILSHPHANHIEGLDWTYQPIPTTTIQQSRGKGEAMDTASRIRELLEEVEKRREDRRNLLRQLRAFDLSVNGVEPVLWHLNKARELSEPGNPVKVALKFFNITNHQLHQILSHPHANHIEGLDGMSQPVPAVMMGDVGKGQEGAGEQAAQDRHKANFMDVLGQIAGRGEQPRNGLDFPVVRAEEEGHDVQRVPFAPDQADGYAPVRIEEIEGEGQVLIAPLQDIDRARFGRVLRQIIEQNNQLPDQANRNVPVENADYIERAEGADEPVLVALEDNAFHGEGGEGADEPVLVALEGINEEDEKREEGEAGDGNDERAEEGDPVGLEAHAHAKLSDLKRSAARRREAPLLTELSAGFEEDNLEPSSELVEEADLAESKDKMEPTVLSWKITPITTEDISNAIQPALQNLGNPNPQARQATSNLVNIYCRHVPGMIRVQ